MILLALSAGAAVCAALLNLQTDAKRRLTSEFRSFGANMTIASRATDDGNSSRTIPEEIALNVPQTNSGKAVAAASFLYSPIKVTAYSDHGSNARELGSGLVVAASLRLFSGDAEKFIPSRTIDGDQGVVLDIDTCAVGASVARHFKLSFGSYLVWQAGQQTGGCVVDKVKEFGSAEDSFVFLEREDLQKALNAEHRASLIQLNVPGTAAEIEEYAAMLQQRYPDVEIKSLRQFSEAQGKIYSRISGLLTAATVMILALTVLCVMAAMTNIAAERRNDVGMMKAIGGSARSVLRLFLTEAALLGLVGGLIGAAVGIALSIGLGKAVFGVAAAPRLIVYPICVLLTVIVAIVGAYPLRRLVNIRPATVLRGLE